MGDDAATVEQLRAELAVARQREATLVAENGMLRDVNAALATERSEALEQQTATADVLRVIASSPTVALPVLEAILHSATRLVASPHALIHILDGEWSPNGRVTRESGAARESSVWTSAGSRSERSSTGERFRSRIDPLRRFWLSIQTRGTLQAGRP